jgi:hypothetical protein
MFGSDALTAMFAELKTKYETGSATMADVMQFRVFIHLVPEKIKPEVEKLIHDLEQGAPVKLHNSKAEKKQKLKQKGGQDGVLAEAMAMFS